jgi:hypothetical protein
MNPDEDSVELRCLIRSIAHRLDVVRRLPQIDSNQ